MLLLTYCALTASAAWRPMKGAPSRNVPRMLTTQNALLQGATGPIIAPETSMDAYADGAPNQTTAPIATKTGSLPQPHRSESGQQLYTPSSGESSPTKEGGAQGMAQNGSLGSLSSATPPGSKLSTIVSNVSSDEGAFVTTLPTVGEGGLVAKPSGAHGALLLPEKAAADLGSGGETGRRTKRKSGLFACCFAASDTTDAAEKVRISMLNDYTHHASAVNGAALLNCRLVCAYCRVCAASMMRSYSAWRCGEPRGWAEYSSSQLMCCHVQMCRRHQAA